MSLSVFCLSLYVLKFEFQEINFIPRTAFHGRYSKVFRALGNVPKFWAMLVPGSRSCVVSMFIYLKLKQFLELSNSTCVFTQY